MTTLPDTRHRRGFSLVEVTLALGIAAFCLLAILGLLPVGLDTNQDSLSQTAAASLARSVVTDLRNTAPSTTSPPAAVKSPVFQISVPPPATGAVPVPHTLYFAEDGTASTPDTDATPTATFVPRYRLTMTFTPPVYTTISQPPGLPAPSSTIRDATVVRLLVTWPAQADPQAATAPTHYTGSYEIVTALNRN